MLLKISAVFLEFAACWVLKWKLKVANSLGKTAVAWGSELTGVWCWASTDCSGFSGTLAWAFATPSAGQRECCELQAPLPLPASQGSAVCGYWLAGLFCFPTYRDQRLWLSGGDGCVWGQGRRASACSFCVRWSGVGEVPADVRALQWALSSCPPRENPWESCCRAVQQDV